MRLSFFDLEEIDQDFIVDTVLAHYGEEEGSLGALFDDFGMDKADVVYALLESGHIPYEHFLPVETEEEPNDE